MVASRQAARTSRRRRRPAPDHRVLECGRPAAARGGAERGARAARGPGAGARAARRRRARTSASAPRRDRTSAPSATAAPRAPTAGPAAAGPGRRAAAASRRRGREHVAEQHRQGRQQRHRRAGGGQGAAGAACAGPCRRRCRDPCRGRRRVDAARRRAIRWAWAGLIGRGGGPAHQPGGHARRAAVVGAGGRGRRGGVRVLPEPEQGVQARSVRPRAARRCPAASAPVRRAAPTTREDRRGSPAPSVHSGTAAQEASACPAAASTTQTAVNTAARSSRRSAPERARGGAVMAGSSSHWAHARPYGRSARSRTAGRITVRRGPSTAAYTATASRRIRRMSGITSTACLRTVPRGNT